MVYMKIAVFSESSSEYGRRLIDGVAAYALKASDLRLTWINPDARPSRQAFDGCDGVVARIANDAIARRLMRTGLPVVDVFCQRPYPGFFGVNSDHGKIGRLAAEHLLAKRYENFAFVGFLGVSFSDKRRRAFLEALDAEGRAAAVYETELAKDQRAFFNTDIDLVPDKRALSSWLAALPRPTAVFAANDLLALNVARLAKDAGLSVPGDLAILGVDDDRLLCAFAETPISSIDPNAFGIGFAAARALAAAIRTPPTKKAHPIYHVAPGEVRERASTERHAVMPEWLGDALGFIASAMDRPLSTSDLVAATGLSHVTISKTFRRRLGMTPLQYIAGVKMRAARALLERGGLLAKEVAQRVGYSSLSRFSIVYKGYWGHSPRRNAGNTTGMKSAEQGT